jgi:hypothetical protein
MSCTDETFQVGDKPRLEGTFTNSAGTAIDPTAVSFKVKDPSGNIDTYVYGTNPEVVKEGTGVYYADIEADEAGTWYYRYFSTGTGQAAGEGSFEVAASQF